MNNLKFKFSYFCDRAPNSCYNAIICLVCVIIWISAWTEFVFWEFFVRDLENEVSVMTKELTINSERLPIRTEAIMMCHAP